MFDQGPTKGDDSASASSSSESTAPAAPALAPAAPEAPAETKMETKGDTTKTEVAAAATTDADAVVVDLALMSNGMEIADYGEGSITISLPFTLPAGRTATNIVVYFLAADGTLVPWETTFVDGQVTFTTAQLGEYVTGTK